MSEFLKVDEELQAIASKKSGADVMNAADDGIAIFVGTRNQVKEKLEALDDLDDA